MLQILSLPSLEPHHCPGLEFPGQLESATAGLVLDPISGQEMLMVGGGGDESQQQDLWRMWWLRRAGAWERAASSNSSGGYRYLGAAAAAGTDGAAGWSPAGSRTAIPRRCGGQGIGAGALTWATTWLTTARSCWTTPSTSWAGTLSGITQVQTTDH